MQAKILNLSKQLIKIPSTKDKPKALQQTLDVIKKHLKDYTIEEFESNGIRSLLAYNTKTRPKKFKLILNGHTDVVAADSDYFKGIVNGSRLTGRGAIDMKAAVAVMTLVFKKLAKNLNYPVALQIVTDEEIGGFDGTKHQVKKGVNADLVIAGEASNFDLAVIAKAPLWLKLTTKGKAGHGAYLWRGKNALKLMSDNIQAISKAFPVPKKEAWQTTCNISKIQSGESINQVPDQCTLNLDIRRIPQDKPQDIVKKIKAACPQTQVKLLFSEANHQVDPKHPLIKLLKKSAKKHNYQPKNIKRHGASDCRHYSDKNINAVEFGPIGNGLHSDNEWVSTKSLATYYQILSSFMFNINQKEVL